MMALVFLGGSFHATASDYIEYGRRQRGGETENGRRSREQNPNDRGEERSPGNEDDSEIVRAVVNRRRVDFVEGRGMVVIRTLADDTNGLRHQKWVVQLSNGSSMMAVYNLDMCERVALKVGDHVAMGGQFVWTNQGALLHWLHYDPRKTRPDGYVEVNGKVYCGGDRPADRSQR